jgi:hypothetical protein
MPSFPVLDLGSCNTTSTWKHQSVGSSMFPWIHILPYVGATLLLLFCGEFESIRNTLLILERRLALSYSQLMTRFSDSFSFSCAFRNWTWSVPLLQPFMCPFPDWLSTVRVFLSDSCISSRPTEVCSGVCSTSCMGFSLVSFQLRVLVSHSCCSDVYTQASKFSYDPSTWSSASCSDNLSKTTSSRNLD